MSYMFTIICEAHKVVLYSLSHFKWIVNITIVKNVLLLNVWNSTLFDMKIYLLPLKKSLLYIL